jgi:hypothetical protein
VTFASSNTTISTTTTYYLALCAISPSATKKHNPTVTMSAGLEASPAWKALEAHYASMKDVQMKDMFATDPERFNKFHLEFEDLLFDFSKNRIDEETMKLLYALAAQQDVHGLAKKMYSGEKISTFVGGFFFDSSAEFDVWTHRFSSLSQTRRKDAPSCTLR